MQRNTDEGVILACDFCGATWTPDGSGRPMIEGHRGSILCLDCLSRAVAEAIESAAPFNCTLCTQEVQPPMKVWEHPQKPAEANAEAALCWDCTQQADRAFSKDADVQWDRQIPPDNRWR